MVRIDKNMNCYRHRLGLFLLITYFVLLTPTFASETNSPVVKQISSTHYETNLVLENVLEDIITISGEKYIYNNHTILNSPKQMKQGLTFRTIPSPCVVDLVYKQYEVTTEAVPYPPGTRILEKLTIIEKIDPATLDSVKNGDYQKMN